MTQEIRKRAKDALLKMLAAAEEYLEAERSLQNEVKRQSSPEADKSVVRALR